MKQSYHSERAEGKMSEPPTGSARKRKPNNDINVAVFGGGAGGISAALELADEGFNVTIYEKHRELLLGSSNATPGRAGHGYHYIHSETGKLYLRATIEVVKKYPGCTLGYDQPEDHYLRHGLYFIMKMSQDLKPSDQQFASQFSTKEVLTCYESLREEYARLIDLDPANKVFGEPEDFFKIEDAENYQDVVDISRVAMVVNTREELVNWPKLRKILIETVTSHPNITIACGTTIRNPHYTTGKNGFSFYANEKLKQASYIINSTWEEVEFLSSQIGFTMRENSRTNRLKTIITVKLPDTLKERPSMFFCMGPHAMFSNMGNGYGMATYAPVTNISSSTALRLEPDLRDCLNKQGRLADRTEKARLVQEGVSGYIPPFSESAIIDMNFGIIKTLGDVDIFDPNSSFHRRDYLGVEERAIGWIDNSCMKLLYFIENGRSVRDLIKTHEQSKQTIHKICNTVISNTTCKTPLFRTHLEKILSNMLFRCYLPKDLIDNADQIQASLLHKTENTYRVNDEIRNLFKKNTSTSTRHRISASSSFYLMCVLMLGIYLISRASSNFLPLSNTGIFSSSNSCAPGVFQENLTIGYK